jgi:hypothetical protein
MRKGIVVNVKAADRKRLAAVAVNRNSTQKHVCRVRELYLKVGDGMKG